jgi:hypothetical protein
VEDQKVILNTAQRSLEDLKNKFLKERWNYEAKVISIEQESLKKKRENFVAQVKILQDSIDIEEHWISRKQSILELKNIIDEENN